MSIRNLFPSPIKRSVKMLLRKYNDLRSGDYSRMARPVNHSFREGFEFAINLKQPIKQSAYFENKIHNISLGISQIEGIVIQPGEIFSFWHLVKKPTPQNNYKLGRNIVSNQLSADYGGGLCQLSSIIYHLSVIGGLKVLERHNHSIDIYKEEERFTPLGADATVVYGHKDLRVQNPYPFPVQLSFRITDHTLNGMLLSTEKIEERTIEFERQYEQRQVFVYTKEVRNDQSILLHCNTYKLT